MMQTDDAKLGKGGSSPRSAQEAASSDAGTEASIRILAFTADQIRTEKDPFTGLKDPNGYLPGFSDGWGKLLWSNPAVDGDDTALVLAVHGQKVVGRLGSYAGWLDLAEKPRSRVMWMDGFFLDPAYLASGAGALILLRTLKTRLPLIANGGPAEGTRKLYMSTGFIELGPFNRRLFPLKIAPFLAWKLPSFPARLLGWLFQPFWLFGRWAWMNLPRGQAGNLVFDQVTRFNSDLDTHCPERTENGFPRDSATLNWSLSYRDALAYEIRDQKRLRGYLMLRVVDHPGGGAHQLPAMKIGRIIDYSLCNATIAELTQMLRFSRQVLMEQKADILECQAHGQLDAACARLWMLVKGGNRVFFRAGRGPKPSLDQPWFLSPGIGDVLLNG
ncbi:MAG: hypothetical protein ABGZ17_29580 [Planctomycetaceae bacterium]